MRKTTPARQRPLSRTSPRSAKPSVDAPARGGALTAEIVKQATADTRGVAGLMTLTGRRALQAMPPVQLELGPKSSRRSRLSGIRAPKAHVRTTRLKDEFIERTLPARQSASKKRR